MMVRERNNKKQARGESDSFHESESESKTKKINDLQERVHKR